AVEDMPGERYADTRKAAKHRSEHQQKHRLRTALRQRLRGGRDDARIGDRERLALHGFGERLQIAFINPPVGRRRGFQLLEAVLWCGRLVSSPCLVSCRAMSGGISPDFRVAK